MEQIPVEFKICTGADVSVVSASLFYSHYSTTLIPSDRTLKDPNQSILDVAGYVVCQLRKGDRTIKDRVYVVRI